MDSQNTHSPYLLSLRFQSWCKIHPQTRRQFSLHHTHQLWSQNNHQLSWHPYLFCGITLFWDYPNHKCFLSMPGCIEAVLCPFHHGDPILSEYQLVGHTPITYGTKIQQPIAPNKYPRLDAKGVHHIK